MTAWHAAQDSHRPARAGEAPSEGRTDCGFSWRLLRLLVGLGGLFGVCSVSIASYPLYDVACPTLGSCTANDVTTTYVSAQPLSTGDTTCSGILDASVSPPIVDTIDVEFTVDFSANADRYDFAILVAKYGDALNGTPANRNEATECWGRIGDNPAPTIPPFADLDGTQTDSVCDYSGYLQGCQLPLPSRS